MATQDAAPSVQRFNVAFEDIVYSVRQNYFSTVRKQLLKGVSGEFRAGDLSVIIGPSGAGKSSLMDILAGYKRPSSGQLLLNGSRRDERFFRQHACYIMQSDLLPPLLTPREALTVAAELKLARHVSREFKKERVEEIINILGLQKWHDDSTLPADTRTGELSGGQRKRLAVGLELVSDPHIIFLDEPTSGLDSLTSLQMVSLLQKLASDGRTLVATIHQPSRALLLMVDRLYAVDEGSCNFIGHPSQLVPYLQENNFPCPRYHNPVDFLLEDCFETDDRRTKNQETRLKEEPVEEQRMKKKEILTRSAQNGKARRWLKPDIQSSTYLEDNDTIFLRQMSERMVLTPLPMPSSEGQISKKFTLRRRYNTSFLRQFSTLFCRSFKTVVRDPSRTISAVLLYCCIAVAVGVLCYQIGEDRRHLQDRLIYNSLYFSLMFNMYTAFSGVTLYFPCDMPIVRREHFNRWYSTSAFYTATIAAFAPAQVVCSVAFSLIVYLMTGQPLEAERCLAFVFVVTLVALIAISVGLLVGTLFDVKNGAVWGPFFIMPYVIFSGFFLSYSDAPSYFRWMFQVSFLNHGLIGLCIAVFGWERQKFVLCTEPDDLCLLNDPVEYLRNLNLTSDTLAEAVLRMCVIWVVVVACAYAVLRLRLKYKT